MWIPVQEKLQKKCQRVSESSFSQLWSNWWRMYNFDYFYTIVSYYCVTSLKLICIILRPTIVNFYDKIIYCWVCILNKIFIEICLNKIISLIVKKYITIKKSINNNLKHKFQTVNWKKGMIRRSNFMRSKLLFQEIEWFFLSWDQIFLALFMRLKYLIIIGSPDHSIFHEIRMP